MLSTGEWKLLYDRRERLWALILMISDMKRDEN